MFKKLVFFCFKPKRFNFLIKKDLSQKKIIMEADLYSSWVPPTKNADSLVTGLHVNNSLWPHKLV